MRNPMMKKNDIIEIASLVAVLIILAWINYLLEVPVIALFATGAGIFFSYILVHISTVYGNASCDYIQTGEAAVGSFAIYACIRFVSTNPYLVLLSGFISLLLYDIYLKILIAPEKNERLLNGILVQAILASIFLYPAASGGTSSLATLEKIFLGFFSSVQINYTGMIAPLGLGIAALSLSLALYPELRLLSQGAFFFGRSRSVITAINIGMTIIRSLLTTATIAFLGWMCGFGLYVRYLSRSRYPGLAAALKLYVFAEFAIILAHYTSPWFAIAFSACSSYILFLYYAKKRKYWYDRY
jgi:hypothetical protein